MKKAGLVLIISILSASFSIAQGTLRGKITDNTGESLIGAIVRLKDKPAVGTLTDLDGLYSLKITDSIPVIIEIAYVSYQSQFDTINPKKGEVLIKDFVLSAEGAGKNIDEVVIEAKASKANNYYMENLKINSSTSMDYISQETMKKTGDANVATAVARVPGVSASS